MNNFLRTYYGNKVSRYFGRTGLMYIGDSFVGFTIRPGETDEVHHFVEPQEMKEEWKAWRFIWIHRKVFK